MKREISESSVVIDFMCDGCGATESDTIGNVVYNGAPLCLDDECPDCQQEMSIFKVFLDED
jgi:hypothetical protein